MIDRKNLNDRQLSLLRRIADGDDLSGEEGTRERISAYALSNRGLIKISKRGGVFRAMLTEAGRARVARDRSATTSQTPSPGEPQQVSTSSQTAPAATVKAAGTRTAQVAELMARLSIDPKFTVVQPTEQELATWRKIVDFAQRRGFPPEGKRLEEAITPDKDLEITLRDEVRPSDEPAERAVETPTVRVPVSLRACHPVIAKLRDDEHRLMMPKPQRRRCLLILQAVALEAQRRDHIVKDEALEKNHYGYYGGGYRARDGAINVTIDGFGFAVKVGQVSPKSANSERVETLVLELPWRGVRGRQTKWADGKRKKVEDILGLVISRVGTPSRGGQGAQDRGRSCEGRAPCPVGGGDEAGEGCGGHGSQSEDPQAAGRGLAKSCDAARVLRRPDRPDCAGRKHRGCGRRRHARLGEVGRYVCRGR